MFAKLLRAFVLASMLLALPMTALANEESVAKGQPPYWHGTANVHYECLPSGETQYKVRTNSDWKPFNTAREGSPPQGILSPGQSVHGIVIFTWPGAPGEEDREPWTATAQNCGLTPLPPCEDGSCEPPEPPAFCPTGTCPSCNEFETEEIPEGGLMVVQYSEGGECRNPNGGIDLRGRAPATINYRGEYYDSEEYEVNGVRYYWLPNFDPVGQDYRFTYLTFGAREITPQTRFPHELINEYWGTCSLSVGWWATTTEGNLEIRPGFTRWEISSFLANEGFFPNENLSNGHFSIDAAQEWVNEHLPEGPLQVGTVMELPPLP